MFTCERIFQCIATNFKTKEMSRNKEKVYVYYEDGSRYAEFESRTEFANHFGVTNNFLSIERKNLFGENIVKIFNTELYACDEPVGRVRVRLYAKKLNSKFIRKRKEKDREIGCYNLERILIATFKSKFYLEAFFDKPITVHEKHVKVLKGDFYFVYI